MRKFVVLLTAILALLLTSSLVTAQDEAEATPVASTTIDCVPQDAPMEIGQYGYIEVQIGEEVSENYSIYYQVSLPIESDKSCSLTGRVLEYQGYRTGVPAWDQSGGFLLLSTPDISQIVFTGSPLMWAFGLRMSNGAGSVSYTIEPLEDGWWKISEIQTGIAKLTLNDPDVKFRFGASQN